MIINRAATSMDPSIDNVHHVRIGWARAICDPNLSVRIAKTKKYEKERYTLRQRELQKKHQREFN